MEFLIATLFGIIQGLTEFLPVSSSGHLLLFQDITGYNSNGLFISLVLHAGTLVSVCIVLWDKIKALFAPPYKTLIYLVIATIPSAILGVLLSDLIDSVFSSGKILPLTFFLTSVLLFLCQKVKNKTNSLSIKTSLFMGIGQTFALLPGLSRSGTTIACGLFAKGNKKVVGEFSFLMSIPIILGGLIVNLYKLTRSSALTLDFSIPALLVGALTSCVVGLMSVKKMLNLVNKGKFTPFCVYLLILSIICAINYYLLPLW